MSRRTSDLLEEMQGIFGGSFGDHPSMTESEDLDEGGFKQSAMRRNAPSDKGRVQSKKKRGADNLRSSRPRKKSKKAVKRAEKATRLRRKSKEDSGMKSFRDDQKKADDQKSSTDTRKKKEREGMKSFRDDQKKADAKKSKKPASDSSGGDSRSERDTRMVGRGGKKTARRHFPFKRSANLGPGPRGGHHDETKCWKCKCGNVYSDGCNCVASGKGENCPKKGTMKKISYTKDYKRKYNDEYHNWRAKQGGRVTQRLGSTRTAL